jgi:hypothetical protein
MCRSIRLPRQQRPKNTEDKPVFGRANTPAFPEAKSLRRDDGSGQAVARVVDASNDAITPFADWPTCSSMNPIRRRPCADPGQKPVPGEWMTQKGIDSSRPVTEAACVVVVSARVSHHGHAGNVRHSPRNGFNGLLRALPGDRAFLPPSLCGIASTNLTPASRRQDHASSPSARPALSSVAPSASIASRPTSVTIAKRPSRRGGMAADIKVIWVSGEGKYFY